MHMYAQTHAHTHALIQEYHTTRHESRTHNLDSYQDKLSLAKFPHARKNNRQTFYSCRSAVYLGDCMNVPWNSLQQAHGTPANSGTCIATFSSKKYRVSHAVHTGHLLSCLHWLHQNQWPAQTETLLQLCKVFWGSKDSTSDATGTSSGDIPSLQAAFRCCLTMPSRQSWRLWL